MKKYIITLIILTTLITGCAWTTDDTRSETNSVRGENNIQIETPNVNTPNE